MHIEVIIPCLRYGDFLSITLPETKRWFTAITVLTAPEDDETIAIAQRAGVSLHLTSSWFKDGARLNKAAAINSCLDELHLEGTDSWVLLLDADIIVQNDLHEDVMTLDPKGLYSVKRRMCEGMEDWLDMCRGRCRVEDFPLYVPGVENGKVWKHRPTDNPAALCGYFQLWHITKSTGLKRMPASPNAADYDVEFAFSFPETARKFIDGQEVLHLGPRKTNWDGRISPRWDLSAAERLASSECSEKDDCSNAKKNM